MNKVIALKSKILFVLACVLAIIVWLVTLLVAACVAIGVFS